MIGQRFGKLTVIEFFDVRNSRERYVCRCDCGHEVIVEKRNLKPDGTKSCGCIRTNNWKKHRGEHYVD